MRHLIKKQLLLLRTAPGLDAFGLQQMASSFYWGEMLPVLERLFDELSSEGECIRLDRLEIDLGTVTMHELREKRMSAVLYDLLRRQLQEAVQGGSDDRKVRVVRESAAEQTLRHWWYYMEHGRLFWGQTPPTDQWYREVLELFSVDHAAVSRLRGAIQSDGVVLRRVIAQHSDVFLETLAGILVAEKQAGLASGVEAILRMTVLLEEWYAKAATAPGLGGKRLVAGVRQRLRMWERRHRDHLSLPGYRRKAYIWRLVLRQAALEPAALRMTRGGAIDVVVRWLLDEDDVLSRFLKKQGGLAGSERSLLPDAPVKKGRRKPGARDGRPGDEIRVEADAVVVSEGEKEKEEGIYLPHAGLILLHPFLATFFSRQGMCVSGQFLSEAAREKAIFLLHFLATGSREAQEYELVLPKLLCGWDDGIPLPRRIEAGKEDYEEAEELLQMVLARWEKLQGTSVEGLRESFLQRPGKLFRRNERMILQVEGHTIDILLDYLPWGLSIVKLPWLKELIYVEWR
jgi:hypothetical protein